jgi:hypothetical protein
MSDAVATPLEVHARCFGYLRFGKITQKIKSLTVWSRVGDGSIGSPSLQIRPFQLSQSSRSACRTMVSASARISADCDARIARLAKLLPKGLEMSIFTVTAWRSVGRDLPRWIARHSRNRPRAHFGPGHHAG